VISLCSDLTNAITAPNDGLIEHSRLGWEESGGGWGCVGGLAAVSPVCYLRSSPVVGVKLLVSMTDGQLVLYSPLISVAVLCVLVDVQSRFSRQFCTLWNVPAKQHRPQLTATRLVRPNNKV
jgi:hypothetical protein